MNSYSSDNEFPGTVTIDTAEIADELDIALSVNGTPLVVEIDSGADVALVRKPP